MSYIEREVAIKLTDEVTKDTTCPIHIAAEIEQVLSQIPTADVESVDRWISVVDRLPDEDVRVLVYLNSDRTYTKIDTDRMCKGNQWIRWGKDVTHWQPLPEPPKGAEE